jgi:hypothetical protein
MIASEITERDRKLAKQCRNCGVCNYARRKQRGIVFWFVKRLEGGICPACKAYWQLHGGHPAEQESDRAS